jgi:glycosyltransferase involved in cell wall biosynthesis
MKILILEPYFIGSHADWVVGYQKYSQHHIEILSLSGQFWKWRMHGGAVTLARMFLSQNFSPDLLIATDMLDLTTFLALTRHRTAGIPVAIYFHENQLCYPWSPDDRDVIQKRDKHYGFINYASALAADAVFFNSQFHKDSFLRELYRFLKHFPDHRDLQNVETIEAKRSVLHLGLDLERFDQHQPKTDLKQGQPPILLWNHRWEYDKNPRDFFRALFILNEQGYDFHVAILGENFSQVPVEFEQAREKLGDKIVQYGFVKKFDQYVDWLYRADIIPVTSNQDFFGASVVAAVYCGCYPILPNRLAYPEIFSLEIYPDNFYNNFDDLIEKLANAVKNIKSIRQQNLSAVVKRYSWQNMYPIYDESFVRLKK